MDVENQRFGRRRLGDDVRDAQGQRPALVEALNRPEVIGLIVIASNPWGRLEIILLEPTGLVVGLDLIADGKRPFVTAGKPGPPGLPLLAVLAG
jgi:hypothetical protein